MKLRKRIGQAVRTTLNVRRALAYVWESSRAWAIGSSFLLVVQGLLPIASLYLLKLMVDTVTRYAGAPDAPAGIPQELLVVLAAAGIVALLTGLAKTAGNVTSREQSRRVVDHMHDVIQTKAVQVDLEYYENAAYQDTLHRAQEESTYRPGAIMHALTMVFQNAISLLGVAWLLLTFHWAVFGVLVFALLPAMVVRFVFSRKEYLRERAYTEKERRAAYYHYMLVGKDFAKEIRTFGLGPTFMNRFRALRRELRRIRLTLDLKNARFASVAHVVSTVLVFSAYFWVAREAVLGAVTIGSFVLFYQAFQRGQTFLNAFLDGVARLYENNLFLENLYEFLDVPARVRPIEIDGTPVRAEPAAVEFENVWFRYPGTDRDVLRGVSLRLEHGQVAALVGLNGTGKTTLVKLLCRLYDPDRGRVLMNGTDIRTLDPEEVRRKLGVIFQDYAQYDLSARDNISFGDVTQPSGDAQITAAADQAGIGDVARSLPAGYDTVLGRLFQDGHELSVGQWQRIALARAFFRDAEFVVLDEPTSAMDPKAEYELFSRFRQITSGRTALLISHRMSTVRMADTIFVLDEGRILEHGSHAELMASGGAYQVLFQTQAKSYVD
jgi:ATP-binding cassette subfamily B protein